MAEWGNAPSCATLAAATANREIIVTTTKPDKYDRYLSDVFLEAETDEATGAIFLNNALLENGHAARKDSCVPADWEQDERGVPK